MTLNDFLSAILGDGLILAVLSGRRHEGPEKVRIRPVSLSGSICYQAEYMENNKAFHRNFSEEELISYLEEKLNGSYRQLQCQGRTLDGTVLSGKKGKLTIRTREHEEKPLPKILPHNRTRNYILPEGVPVPFLVDLGVMTAEGKVVASRYDKFRQINRFLEYVRDILPYLPDDREIRILDFGCGKSYLTFAIYYYLHELLGREVRITGLDLKEDVIDTCSRLSEKYGYDHLSFRTGNVEDYDGDTRIDMMVTLHACDTATDYALYKAASWNAGVILSVPCCQHELNSQIKGGLLEPVLKYGILKERMASLITDGIRAELLESRGYRVQLLEFISMEHTPKNILIRAVRTDAPGKHDISSLEDMMQSMNLDPTLYRLLTGEQNEKDTSQAAYTGPDISAGDDGNSSAFE